MARTVYVSVPAFLKQWKYQALLSAPFLPWLYIHWTTWMYETMTELGWDHGRMDGPVVATVILSFSASVVFLIGYCRVHDKW